MRTKEAQRKDALLLLCELNACKDLSLKSDITCVIIKPEEGEKKCIRLFSMLIKRENPRC